MIVEEGKYYLYRHLNPNTNLPFYIGIGTKQNKNHRSFKATYYRAHTFHKENSIWKNIVNKNGFVVEIIIESDDYQFILNKEVEFITLYGRKDIKTGILANLTNGGEGSLGRKYTKISEKHRKILSERMKINNPNKGGNSTRGLPNPKQSERMKKNNPRKFSKDVWSRKIYQYSLEGNFLKEWKSIKEAENFYGRRGISNSIRRKTSYSTFIWKYEYLGLKISPYIKNTKELKFLVYTKDTEPYICVGVKSIVDKTGISKSKIFKILKTGNWYKNCMIQRM